MKADNLLRQGLSHKAEQREISPIRVIGLVWLDFEN